MSWTGNRPAASRREFVVGGVAALVTVASGAGLRAQTQQQQQQPPPQTTGQPPQQPAPAQNDVLKFETPEPRVVVITMAPDAEQAFETALQKAKDLAAKPDAKPELKQQAAHWKVAKSVPGTDGNITVLMTLGQTVPNATYNPFGILATAGMTAEQWKADIQPLEDKVNGGIKAFIPLVISPVVDMGTAGAGH